MLVIDLKNGPYNANATLGTKSFLGLFLVNRNCFFQGFSELKIT